MTALVEVLAAAHAAPPQETMLTGPELAALVHVAAKRIHEWAKEAGIVATETPGCRFRFQYHPSEYRAWLDRQKPKKAA